MHTIMFITGNQKKADTLSRYLDFPITHTKIDLDEIQSLELGEIIEHKARQAYDSVKQPIIVEDVSLEFCALGRIPGPFIRFFLEELGPLGLSRLLDGKDRRAIARCMFGYYDGIGLEIFEGSIEGTISEQPKGENGFGWDQIFIPYFTDQTSAELTPKEYERFYTEAKPIKKVRKFLLSLL